MSERLIDPGGKILRHPETIAALRRGDHVWPLAVEMDLSNACQLKCSHCDFAYTHDGEVMPSDLASEILVDLAKGGTLSVTFTGGGEPTLNPAFAMIVQVARAQGLQVGLYTNGVAVERLLECLECFSWVYISLDAVGPLDYKATKDVPAFERVAGNVTQLAQRKKRPTLGLGFLLHDGNWFRARRMVELATELRVDYAQFRPVVGLKDYRWVQSAGSMLTEERLRHPGDVPVYVASDRFYALLNGFTRTYSVCRGSELVPCVGAQGELWVCLNHRGGRSLGNLNADSFRNLWAARQTQMVGADCRDACRNHGLNETLEYCCTTGAHDAFV